MHPRLAAVIAYADIARSELLAAIDEISEPLREARPAEMAWSAAEVLEHLTRVEKGVAKLVALKVGEMQTLEAPPPEAPDMVAVELSRFTMIADRSIHIDAPERVVPEGEMSASAARAALLETRGMLLDQLHAGDGLAYSTILHPHPLFGALNLYEWVFFIGAHERRHTAQIREIAAHFRTA